MTRVLIFLLLASTFVRAQDRFLVRVNDPDNARLVNNVQAVNNVVIIRNFGGPVAANRPNTLAVTADPDAFDQLRASLALEYQGNFVLAPDETVIPNEGSGDPLGDPVELSPPPSNHALDSLVPGHPIADPPTGILTGKIIIDIVGTGIDQSHPVFADLSFEPPLSVMFASGGGFLPGDIDYHNHETRIASCIGGLHTGLLTALGTREGVRYRSVLCYDKPTSLTPAVPTTFSSDCIAAISEIISAHEERVIEPYLRNHGAVISFSHTVETPGTRVGVLDSLFDLAWKRGIFTSISGGNAIGPAAATSPSGAGEWIIYSEGGALTSKRYWPPIGYASFALPATVGFEVASAGFDYHLKTGAHDNAGPPSPWTLTAVIGSALNTPNPPGYGPPENAGVDLFAPGKNIPVAATRLKSTPGEGAVGPFVFDGSTYYLQQGYQVGNGTSYSAAYSSAAAARILQMRPWASPAQVREALLGTSGSSFETLTLPDLVTLDPMSLDYDAWIARYLKIATFGFFDAGLDAKNADPDGDGVINLIEYLCGMDPRYPDAHHAPKVTFDREALKLENKMQLASYLPEALDIKWRFQSSLDLETWSSEGQGDIVFDPQNATNGDGLNLTATLNIESTEPKKFFRFQITTAP